MNKPITLLLLLLVLSFNCANDNHQTNTINEIDKIEVYKANDGFTINDTLYKLHFQIEETKENKNNLVVSIELYNNSYYISPTEKKEFKGKFTIDLGSYDKLTFNENIIETPRSVGKLSPNTYVEGSVNWVKENTTYKQPLKVLSQDDFEVFGRVIFTIEPRCTLEEIPFSISYHSGKMTIKYPKC